jgi:hypothetical protein
LIHLDFLNSCLQHEQTPSLLQTVAAQVMGCNCRCLACCTVVSPSAWLVVVPSTPSGGG